MSCCNCCIRACCCFWAIISAWSQLPGAIDLEPVFPNRYLKALSLAAMVPCCWRCNCLCVAVIGLHIRSCWLSNRCMAGSTWELIKIWEGSSFLFWPRDKPSRFDDNCIWRAGSGSGEAIAIFDRAFLQNIWAAKWGWSRRKNSW